MSYPYPQLTQQLKFYCTPDQYRRIPRLRGIEVIEVIEGVATRDQYPHAAEYVSLLPVYTYAECPICHQRCNEPIDTYSLERGHYYRHLLGYNVRPDRPHCPHFFGYQLFLNLHNQLPIEVEMLGIQWGEVPYITDWLISDDMPSYAVLHGLPICRIEDNQFNPTYTEFILTYFSEDPDLLMKQFFKRETDYLLSLENADVDEALIWMSTVGPSDTSTISYDLASYAQKGRLGWMDIRKPDLPLQIGEGEVLPSMYQNIVGERKKLSWSVGEFGNVL